ncbi:FAD-binding oxidoreductase [Vitiosangium sp. GDMCC 1.1324]|uniref:FAD-binding oxidoreductase n=1 Tax=Vitiosangium sp. (strain GDMCC 1.1324) TaxID=2138576 RepID=UPI000D354753|nr:FAD-binding oxidoreductase [Vitiosangium sp. GDMCC 1.1324]PTL81411.1 FAD-binding oxidoreductase [Vitiosangium sp. GDMCC 1.1324]
MELKSWGRYPRVAEQRALPVTWTTEPLPVPTGGATLLPYGQGRSYGDSCLNAGGALLTTARLDRFLDFNPATGVLRCESGVTLDAILRLVSWQGWFLPVTPGTKFVSVGGAIANDVHGKNHHRAGTFGRHVPRFELVRSDGSRRVCSLEENRDWYEATIGGLGLTGLITWADVQLRRVSNPYIFQETIPFSNLDGFLALTRESERDFEFTVAWVDSLARGKQLGRGLFYRGNHAPPQFDAVPLAKSHLSHRSGLAVPFDFPVFALNRLSVAAINWLYYHWQRAKPAEGLVHYDPFFYPLDGVHRWNRIYGRRGFLQFQCVVPDSDAGVAALREVLERSARSGMPSFVTVLKMFGDVPSPGMMSFPKRGVTLALDFANRGERTYRLVEELDRLTREAGGRVYPAKDARMSPESFAAYYPERERFSRYVDPAFSSSFWRRVNGAG